MAAPKLSPEQQNKVIEMLAARESYMDIAKAVGCSWANIDYYAKRYREQIDKAQQQYDARFIDRGLRSRGKRLEKLEVLANKLEYEMSDFAGVTRGTSTGLWVKDYKGPGGMVEVEVFVAPIVSQYRETLNDIAKELGHRVSKNETTLIADPYSEVVIKLRKERETTENG